jgi:hypothetical protein
VVLTTDDTTDRFVSMVDCTEIISYSVIGRRDLFITHQLQCI